MLSEQAAWWSSKLSSDCSRKSCLTEEELCRRVDKIGPGNLLWLQELCIWDFVFARHVICLLFWAVLCYFRLTQSEPITLTVDVDYSHAKTVSQF